MSITENSENSPLHILVAEDSPTQAQQLEYILQQHHYRVTTAANGRLALEAARRAKPALVLSDVVMPEMDGYELCRQIKADAELSDIPVILVTTLSDPHDVIRGLECRADNFILKPYDEDHLLNRVRFILANRQMCHTDHVEMGVEIFFNGQKHFITADRLQILNLLLSTYDAAIQRNKELSFSQQNLREINSRLEAANRELDAFSHSVSHDLQAPVRTIHGFSQLLLKSSVPLPEREQRLLQHICASAEQMGVMIESLLRLSQLGRQNLSLRPLKMNDLVQQIIDEQAGQREGREVEIRVAALPDCFVDPMLMKQVWVNLFSNALKYTRKREKAVIEIGGEKQNGEKVYFIRDNGAGFDMEFAANLFGAFQRLHSADEFEGTGVGLSVAQRIVQRHGGRIWAEAEVDKGAIFYFSVPDSRR